MWRTDLEIVEGRTYFCRFHDSLMVPMLYGFLEVTQYRPGEDPELIGWMQSEGETEKMTMISASVDELICEVPDPKLDALDSA